MRPYKIARNGPSLSHLFFVDDLVLMAKNNSTTCKTLKDTLQNFCKWSGKTINNNKSKILFSSNASFSTVANTANFFNMNYCTNFGRYLGFPIFDKKPSPADYGFIIDNLTKKLAEWKTKFLTLAGRTTLAKATLNNVPNYVMSYIKLPKQITDKIDQLQRNFIWGTTSGKKSSTY